MTLFPTTLMFLLHPGDLGLEGWLKMFLMFFFLIVVPIFLIGFIIYKVARRE